MAVKLGAAVIVLCAPLLVSCQSDSKTAPSSAGTGTPSLAASPSAAPVLAATPSPPPAFAAVDWARVTVTGRACFSSKPIRLHPKTFLDVDERGTETRVRYGAALIPSAKGYPEDPSGNGPSYVQLTNTPTAIKYGRFGGQGQVPVAAVPFTCDNNGGTASGQLLFSIALYTRANGGLHLLGLITPRQERNDNHVTLLEIGSFSTSGLTVQEAWYGPSDATCCPTGQAISTWQYDAGKLCYVATRITKQAKGT